jgi:hypothetical protein
MYYVTSNHQDFLRLNCIDEAKRLANSLRGYVFNMLDELVYTYKEEEEC